MPMTVTREEVAETAETAKVAGVGEDGEGGEFPETNLAQVPCIRYSITFQRKSMSALFDLGSKVNTIYLASSQELGLPIRLRDVKAQKIDGNMLDTYEMIVATFLVTDKANQVRFFEETFIMANISPNVILGMLFLTLSGANVDFLDRKLC